MSKMKLVTLAIFGLASLCLPSFAGEAKLSKDEFLKLLSLNKLALEKTPYVFPIFDENGKPRLYTNLPPEMQKHLTDKAKERSREFTESMWFIHYVKTNQYVYSVVYEWERGKCIFRTEEIDPSIKAVPADKVDMSGQEIPITYCERLYSFTKK